MRAHWDAEIVRRVPRPLRSVLRRHHRCWRRCGFEQKHPSLGVDARAVLDAARSSGALGLRLRCSGCAAWSRGLPARTATPNGSWGSPRMIGLMHERSDAREIWCTRDLMHKR